MIPEDNEVASLIKGIEELDVAYCALREKLEALGFDVAESSMAGLMATTAVDAALRLDREVGLIEEVYCEADGGAVFDDIGERAVKDWSGTTLLKLVSCCLPDRESHETVSLTFRRGLAIRKYVLDRMFEDDFQRSVRGEYPTSFYDDAREMTKGLLATLCVVIALLPRLSKDMALANYENIRDELTLEIDNDTGFLEWWCETSNWLAPSFAPQPEGGVVGEG